MYRPISVVSPEYNALALLAFILVLAGALLVFVYLWIKLWRSRQ